MIVIHVARKPLIGSVAKNVLAHGTGGLNIDGCRIGSDEAGWGGRGGGLKNWNDKGIGMKEGAARPVVGRWPANLVLEHTPQCKLKGRRPASTLDVVEQGTIVDSAGYVEIWDCVEGCPAKETVIQGGSSDFFFQVQGTEDPPEYDHAAGDVVCPTCGKPYSEHPLDARYDWLNVLCDGSLVKL